MRIGAGDGCVTTSSSRQIEMIDAQYLIPDPFDPFVKHGRERTAGGPNRSNGFRMTVHRTPPSLRVETGAEHPAAC